jgi:hypothetical protein
LLGGQQPPQPGEKKMNIRMIVLLIALCTLPTLAQAADKTVMATEGERAALLQISGSGLSITSNSQQYQILSGVRAAEIQSDELPHQTLTRMGGDKLIETKGSFVVFSAQKSAASVTSVNGTSYPTAYNPRSGGIGIVPGTLNVKLKTSGKASAIAKDHGLDVVRVFTHLQTAVYRVKPGQDVVAVATALAADARVVNAEVEVIENINAPN